MKSLVWTGPRQLEIQDTPVLPLRDGDVLLKVYYAGICGSELSGYLGKNSIRKPPLVMGHEFSGEIIEICGRNHDLQVGDLVTANPLVECGQCRDCQRGTPQHCKNRQLIGISVPGAYADYVRVPARACLKVDDLIAGCLVEPLACSVRSVRQSQLVAGDNIVVFGAGMIGLFALRVAELVGASQRILVDTNPERLQFGKQFGATDTVHARESDPVAMIRNLTNGNVPRVIDAVGSAIVRQQAVQIVENRGTVVFIGLHDDATTLPGNTIARSEISVVGSFAYDRDDFMRASTMFNTGAVRYDRQWLDIRPLSAGKEAFDEQIDGPAKYPKILLSPCPEQK